MDRFTDSAHDGGWSPRNVGAPVFGPVPADSWADAYPYPAFLDDPEADHGREAFGLDVPDHDFAGLDAEGRPLVRVDAQGLDVTGADAVDLDLVDIDRRQAEELSPAVLRAELRVRRIEMLVGGLSRHQAIEAQIHADRARDIRQIAVLLGAESENPIERVRAPSVAAAEIAAELSMPPRSARALVAECLALTEPDSAPVLAALAEGQLDRPRAQAILRAGAAVPAASTLEFTTRAVDLAVTGSADGVRPSLPALQRSLRRMAQKYSSETFEERARIAREHRRVDIEPADDGMCHLSALLPLEDGAVIDTRLQAIARNQSADDPRTVAQRRVDALIALLCAPSGPDVEGGAAAPRGGVRTEIVVTVPPATVVPEVHRCPAPPAPNREAAACPAASEQFLCEASGGTPRGSYGVAFGCTPDDVALGDETWEIAFGNEPGEIIGYGLIPADAARRLAARARTWLRILTDSDTGEPLALGRTRYTPPPALRRQLALRDGHCRFPACDRPHAHTEADHTLEWARGGTTKQANLALLCPEHHRLKTIGLWNAEQDPHDGTIIWTSPLGRTHVTTPGDPKPPPF